MGRLIQFKKIPVRERKPRRMTPELLDDLLRVHMSCVHDQEGRCPLLVSIRSLTWEINKAMNVANDEDRGFRRTHADGLCAAKPFTMPFDHEGELDGE